MTLRALDHILDIVAGMRLTWRIRGILWRWFRYRTTRHLLEEVLDEIHVITRELDDLGEDIRQDIMREINDVMRDLNDMAEKVEDIADEVSEVRADVDRVTERS